MGKHSVAEARNNLSELINRALQGEGVVTDKALASVARALEVELIQA
jgi:antitoxin (DNA-binding transcriptional repressor) of toxin-antitoxin stability system